MVIGMRYDELIRMRSTLELVLALELKVDGSDVNISSPLISALNKSYAYVFQSE